MASDDTRPKVRMLFTIGVVSVFLLLGIKFVLDSYYLDMTETYEHGLIPPTTLRDQTKTEQLDAIEKGQNGAIPVDVAMQMLEQKGRESDPDIRPEQSDDIDALKGWAKLKHAVKLPPQQAAEAADAGAPAPATNADAGAVPTTTGDAGARPQPHAPTAPKKDGGK